MKRFAMLLLTLLLCSCTGTVRLPAQDTETDTVMDTVTEEFTAFSLQDLPQTFTLHIRANDIQYGSYDLLCGYDTTEPHGIAVYLMNGEGYQKCTVDIPEDWEYDRLEFWPVMFGWGSVQASLGLMVCDGDTAKYTSFGIWMGDGVWNYRFMFENEYPEAYAEYQNQMDLEIYEIKD